MICFKRQLSLEDKLNILSFATIYEASAKSRKIKLFKVLLTNSCQNNCLYCENRQDRKFKPLHLTPEEVVKTFQYLVLKNFSEGIFISSALDDDIYKTQEKIIKAAQIIREKQKFKGYIHLKILPNIKKEDYIEEAVKLADRVSINLEAPNKNSLNFICPDKNFFNLLWILKKIKFYSRIYKKSTATQIIISDFIANDKEILQFTEFLYKKLNINRIYFSGFIPISQTPLENKKRENPLRIRRLYQSSFLIRDYGISADELVYNQNKNLPLLEDPKVLYLRGMHSCNLLAAGIYLPRECVGELIKSGKVFGKGAWGKNLFSKKVFLRKS